ncbi:MAG: hypothetical protein IT294_03580 [Deltaproteobacteria bacterium]|nr:hypothetical protein [Deltaproteobacteria bacterium]
MTRYRDALPQLGLDLFHSDGDVATTRVFLAGHERPRSAAFRGVAA